MHKLPHVVHCVVKAPCGCQAAHPCNLPLPSQLSFAPPSMDQSLQLSDRGRGLWLPSRTKHVVAGSHYHLPHLPRFNVCRSEAEAFEKAHQLGYPVMIRPSYVLGGRAMEIIYNDDDLKR